MDANDPHLPLRKQTRELTGGGCGYFWNSSPRLRTYILAACGDARGFVARSSEPWI